MLKKEMHITIFLPYTSQMGPAQKSKVRLKRKSKLAFTLTEMLLVIGIILSLAGLSYPTYATARRSAKIVICANNLRQIYTSAQLYAADNADSFPRGKDGADILNPSSFPASTQSVLQSMPKLSSILAEYRASGDTWKCPLDTGAYVLDGQPLLPLPAGSSLWGATGMSYKYQTGLAMSSASWSSIPAPSATLLLTDEAGHWHSGASALQMGRTMPEQIQAAFSFRYQVVFVDGHVRKSMTYRQVINAWGGS